MVGRLVLCVACLLLGQAADPLDQRRRLALATTHPTGEELRAVRSDRITRALRSPDAMWAFVTSPET